MKPNATVAIKTGEVTTRSKRRTKESKVAEKKNATRKEYYGYKYDYFQFGFELFLIVLLLVVSMQSGLRIGYGIWAMVNPRDALKKETWMHILDIMKVRVGKSRLFSKRALYFLC